MSFAIPQQIQLDASLPVLPECTNTSVIISPSNGGSFNNSSANQIIFDLGSSGFLDPDTLTFRAKIAIANATSAASLYGGGVGIINRVEIYLGSTVVETLNNYNLLYSDMVNLSYNYAQKGNLAITHGYLDLTTAPTSENVNAWDIPSAGNNLFIALPLSCILSQCQKMIPLFLMPQVRIVMTLETIANAFTGSTPTVTGYTVTNAEISYDMVRFSNNVEQLVKAMGGESGKLYLKSQSMTFTGASLSSGASGSMQLIYNQRISSLKGVLAHLVSLDGAKATNKAFDSVEITQGGTYQFYVNSIPYPARQFDCTNNKSAVMAELRAFIASNHNVQASNMAITQREFAQTITSTTTSDIVGKFFVGVNLEKIQGDSGKALLSGISTSNSPISLQISTAVALPNACTVYLLCVFDALIEIDVNMKNASVKI
jgi:hypothetical protein